MLPQTKTHISEAPLCTHMLHLTKTHIVLRSQSPQVTNKLLFSGSSSPCCSIHAGNICQTTSNQWGWYRNRPRKVKQQAVSEDGIEIDRAKTHDDSRTTIPFSGWESLSLNIRNQTILLTKWIFTFVKDNVCEISVKLVWILLSTK